MLLLMLMLLLLMVLLLMLLVLLLLTLPLLMLQCFETQAVDGRASFAGKGGLQRHDSLGIGHRAIAASSPSHITSLPPSHHLLLCP